MAELRLKFVHTGRWASKAHSIITKSLPTPALKHSVQRITGWYLVPEICLTLYNKSDFTTKYTNCANITKCTQVESAEAKALQTIQLTILHNVRRQEYHRQLTDTIYTVYR